jgi:BlaI family transcriptional regulator, penicillinase repressor
MKPQLTRQELRIMNVVWAKAGATGREVKDALSVEKPIAYTTVVTLMNILVGKGHLEREAAGRQYRYRPKVSQKKALSALVRDFVDRVFAGSPQSLMAHLVEEERLSPDEIRQLLESGSAEPTPKGRKRS